MEIAMRWGHLLGSRVIDGLDIRIRRGRRRRRWYNPSLGPRGWVGRSGRDTGGPCNRVAAWGATDGWCGEEGRFSSKSSHLNATHEIALSEEEQ